MQAHLFICLYIKLVPSSSQGTSELFQKKKVLIIHQSFPTYCTLSRSISGSEFEQDTQYDCKVFAVPTHE